MGQHKCSIIDPGSRFGRWTVQGPSVIHKKSRKYLCHCDCGNTGWVFRQSLFNKTSSSCGCFHRENAKAISKHGGMWDTPTHRVWSGVLSRCCNPGNKSYSNYGGRGITVCEEWKDFSLFHSWALSSGYQEGLEIDRTNNNGGYCPENCRWVSRSVNCRNRRNNLVFTAFGETKTAKDWHEDSRCVVPGFATLCQRIRNGWQSEKALSHPVEYRGQVERL